MAHKLFDAKAARHQLQPAERSELPKSPTEGDWRMSIPCLPDDVAWSSASLAAASSRISARSVDEEVEDDEPAAAPPSSLSINLSEFLKS